MTRVPNRVVLLLNCITSLTKSISFEYAFSCTQVSVSEDVGPGLRLSMNVYGFAIHEPEKLGGIHFENRPRAIAGRTTCNRNKILGRFVAVKIIGKSCGR